MASSRANKRAKVSSSPKEPVTTLDNKAFDEEDVAESRTHTKMNFRCPVTIDNVFSAPTPTQVKVFYESRSSKGKSFDHLPKGEKLAWTESFHDNKTLMGFIVYAQLFPKLLQNRIKLNAATYHWAHLDNSSEKGRTKLEQRRRAVDRLKRNGSTRSVFMGLPYRVDTSADILAYMKMDVEEEDERFRFFTKREFSMIFSKRGQVGSSSVYASCSMALSLLWFATAVLARPCCLESIILPLSVTERRAMEQRFKCPPQFFDGPIQSFQTNWKDVFAAIDTHHRNINYTMLEKACEHEYIKGVHIADVYAVFRATMTVPDDMNSIAALVRSYNQHAKHGVESGAVVGVIDVIRDKSLEAIGKIDGGVLGSIFSAYGERACLKVQAECSRLEGGSSLFDDSVSNKLNEILAHFDCELWKARKKDKVDRVVAANMDPAGMNKKIEAGKMLDPTDPKSIDRMHTMLTTLSGQVWKPLKKLIGKALGASLEYPAAFLRISQEEGEQLYKHVLTAGVTYTDVANLCTLLLLSFSFQRSQVLRESTVDEFVLVPDATHYKFSFKNRRFKTASSRGTSSAPPVSHFMLTPDQSMITRFIAIVGHRFCGTPCLDNEARRLFVNTKGQSWTQKDISSRFKRIGMHWLGISNFGPHVCRTFWSTHALHSGQISGSNLEDFSSFLQVSSTTLRNSYMAAAANTAAHTVGNDVLGGVVNSACTGETTEKGARPYGKKLSARRLEFAGEIRASLAKYSGNGRLLFRALLQKRNTSQLVEGEKWFRWENTFFSQSDERLFQRFVDKVNA
ncbi:unnamed protein product [Ectocarpus fasciculatus]